MPITNDNGGLSVKAYRGDAKTLLAFNLTKAKTKNLAGFTIQVGPDGQTPYFIQNFLQFEDPSKHAQDLKLPPTSSFNAPIHKFRWIHFPGSLQQGTKPFFGLYTYTVTPRYFDANGSLQPIDKSLSVPVSVEVAPFAKGPVEIAFTRGFTQSQAFVHHFGLKAKFKPKEKELLFDTSQVSGTDNEGNDYTFTDEYDWLGFTARQKVFEIANEVLKDKTLRMDVFAYDLNEPDLLQIFLKLAKQGRIRIILDNATLHHASKPKKAKKASAPSKAKKGAKKPKSPPPEDQFEALFKKAAKKPAEIQRGKFKRFAHDKVFVVRKKKGAAVKVLTGSTNFSVTGMYVNSNHILVFNAPEVAETYAQIFDIVWEEGVSVKFNKTPQAAKVFSFSGDGLPEMEITFSPHTKDDATKFLDNLVTRMEQEQKTKDGSILFAVMGVDTGSGPVLPALRELHADENIFTYGISDSPGDGLRLYTPRQKTGVLVSGKPIGTTLPPPFDQVPQISLGHQVHHKFVVCGFNRDDATLYCGSSNLALGGEQENGDNLITIHDTDIATAFAIDALTLVDHFDFLDRSAKKAKEPATKIKEASKQQQAVNAHWFLSTDDTWASPYYDDDDLRSVDRKLFA